MEEGEAAGGEAINQSINGSGRQHVSSPALASPPPAKSDLLYFIAPFRSGLAGRKFLNEERPARPPQNCRVYGGSCLAAFENLYISSFVDWT
jgi:hypothetical protein